MLKTFLAKDGNLTAEWNGVLLHSSYSPLKEVEKFLNSQLTSPTRTAVILGDPLGYIHRETLKRFPGIKIIHISYDPSFSLPPWPDLLQWNPDNELTLHGFLNWHLNDLDLIHLTMLSWTPSAKVFNCRSEEYTRVITQFIRERKASLFTTGGFGKKWLRNSIKNFLSLSCPSIFSLITNKPILLAASGFSLTRDVQVLKKYREKFLLWSLPSAVLFLHDQGIIPDLIIQTDPGFYTRYHLRIPERSPIPLAMPLSSSLEYGQTSRPVLLFSQGHFFESALLETFEKPFITLPSTGTVAAAALQFGFLSRPPLLITGGLDLMSHDIHEHVFPNGFLPFMHQSSHRTSPLLTNAYERVVSQGKKKGSGWQSLQLQTYTEWLNRFLVDAPDSLYRLNPSDISINGFHPLSGDELIQLFSSSPAVTGKYDSDPCTLTRKTKIDRVEKLLNHFIHSLEQADLPASGFEKALKAQPLVYNLFTYLSLPGLIALLKKKDSLTSTAFIEEYQDLRTDTVMILQEFKRDFLS